MWAASIRGSAAGPLRDQSGDRNLGSAHAQPRVGGWTPSGRVIEQRRGRIAPPRSRVTSAVMNLSRPWPYQPMPSF